MDKTFDPIKIEHSCHERWNTHELYKAQGKGQPYCIILPPPNVTGSLHMGHAFQDTLMDALTRYHIMKGDKTLWQMGKDHAGIATQMVVERQLNQQGQSRHDLGREAFIERIWAWKKESGDNITSQMNRLGAAADWSREKFTMDPEICDAVKEVFVQLYEEDLIYRGKRLVNWDPSLKTAVSDLEVINEEKQGSIWTIAYPIVDSDERITIATTRPETLLGDVAVAVHPEDERYAHLIGQHCILPYCDRTIPIIADDAVERDFGTGCVKITPAHDFNDYEMGKRHQLEMINILTDEARLNENTPEPFRGLDRFEARTQIVNALTADGYLLKVEPHALKIPKCDRTGEVIEPYLTDQWFVKVAPLAKPAIEAVESGDITFVPKNWEKTYFEWMHNINDWCISRQLWWGHRVPAWYDDEGKIFVGRSLEEIKEKYKLSDVSQLKQDEDVLDTWFSSALWPFTTLGWPNQTTDLDEFYPSSVLVTGFDIIFFWVARMIMMGLKFQGKVPFKHVYVHGLIQDAHGVKMSKSKGNVIDPIDLIDGITQDQLVQKRTHGLMQPAQAKQIAKQTKKDFPDGIAAYGTDALRFTFCAIATHARHIRFEMPRIEGYRNFCNKLWNATRYVMMQTEGKAVTPYTSVSELSIAERWILTRLQSLKTEIAQHIETYRFDLLAKCQYEFIWSDYCDWFLELTKSTLYSDTISEGEKGRTRFVLLSVLEEILRCLHPLMPYITEAIWQNVGPMLGHVKDSIIQMPYPCADAALVDVKSEAQIEWAKAVVLAIRNIRGELNISPNKPINILLKGTKSDHERMSSLTTLLIPLMKIESVTWLEKDQTAPPSAAAVCDTLELFVPIAGLIDKDEELARLDRELSKLKIDIDKAEKKLNNPAYTDKAPVDIVEKERSKLSALVAQLEKLEATKLQVQKI